MAEQRLGHSHIGNICCCQLFLVPLGLLLILPADILDTPQGNKLGQNDPQPPQGEHGDQERRQPRPSYQRQNGDHDADQDGDTAP